MFTEDFEVTEDGTYVVSDSVNGSLWLVDPSGTITPGLVPSSFAPGQGLSHMATCLVPPVPVEGIPYDLGGGFAPGIDTDLTQSPFLAAKMYVHD